MNVFYFIILGKLIIISYYYFSMQLIKLERGQ